MQQLSAIVLAPPHNTKPHVLKPPTLRYWKQQPKMHRCKVTRWTHRAWTRYFYTKTHSRTAAWTCWRKHEVTQCGKGTASGQAPWSVSLLAVKAGQHSVPDSRTCCRRCHGIANGWAEKVWPLPFWMPKSSSKAQGCSRSQVLHSHAGAEHEPKQLLLLNTVLIT